MAEKALQAVKFESAFGEVTLTNEDVKKYLVRGGGNVTDQEIKLFMELCKYQKLNPFVGECYPIKFGNDFQLVVGYEAYKRRAEENPSYTGRKSGIVVVRGDQVVKKEGTCLYPNEQLIGGWCRVNRKKDDKEFETYKEVSLKEYDKGQANWKTKPCTMIEKVAVSQALRAAFPVDYEGMYTFEEVEPHGYKYDDDNMVVADNVEEVDETITQEQRQQMFALAQKNFGREKGNEIIKNIISEEGLKSTSGMLKSQYDKVMKILRDTADAQTTDTKSA